MPRSQPKTSTTNAANSYSYIFSDLSRAIHREESLTRKLKHIQNENLQLEQQIKQQEEEIKDERTVIIYQMNQLAKAVLVKVSVNGQIKVDRSMLTEDGIKLLMNKFEDIEKQQKMVRKVRDGLDRMYESYDQHKKNIDQIMQESNIQHHQIEQKMHSLIEQKKTELQKTQQEIQNLYQDIKRMQEQIHKFEEDDPNLDKEQQILYTEILYKQKELVQLAEKFKQISKWEEIVVDRKARLKLMGDIQRKRGEMRGVEGDMGHVGVRVKEVNMKIGKI